jgi:hypothetical protein
MIYYEGDSEVSLCFLKKACKCLLRSIQLSLKESLHLATNITFYLIVHLRYVMNAT